MRIVVNDIAANKSGAMSVLRDFYACVCENDKENEWIFLLNKKYFPETKNVRIIERPDIKESALKKVVFDFFTGARYINELKPDAVLSLQNILTFGVSAPQVLYVHQALPFQKLKKFSFFKSDERSSAIKQSLVGRIIRYSVKKADSVIVQTKWMKDAVCRICAVETTRVTICRPEVKLTDLLKDEIHFDPSFFFYPTNDSIYKNNSLLFAASSILTAEGLAHTVELTLDKKLSNGSVHCIGFIPHEQVIEKYQRATLVFPSYIETFGYPLAEARNVGSIILAADTPFSRELLDGYENAYFFAHDRVDQLTSLMRKVIKGEIVRNPVETLNPSDQGENCWISVMRCVQNAEKQKK